MGDTVNIGGGDDRDPLLDLGRNVIPIQNGDRDTPNKLM